MATFKRGALIERIASTATANSTTTLTADSVTYQQFTGTQNEVVALPDATTMVVGQHFVVQNRSTGFLTINLNGGANLTYVAPGAERDLRLTDKSSAPGVWDTTAGEDHVVTPLKLTAATTPDSKLYIAASTVITSDGSAQSVPPTGSLIPSFVASHVDFQAQTTSGGVFNITFPAGTVGYYVRVGFTLLSNGTMEAIFSAEAATLGSLANPGTLFIDGIPVGWVDLECTNALGLYKTVGSTADVIEHAVGGISRISRFGSGAVVSSGGGGGDSFAKLVISSIDGYIYTSSEDGQLYEWI